MEKLREELAKLLFDWIDDDGWEWWEVDKDVRDHYRNKTDSILSLPSLREALEKATGKVEVNESLVDALKAVYRKHVMDDDSIGWDELSDIVKDALCDAIGDERFNEFLSEVKDVEKG